MTYTYNPNIYTANLDDTAVAAAIAHAKAEFPNEACGAIIEGVYVQYENKADDPSKEFLIDDPSWYENYSEGRVECLVHSHNDCNRATFVDQSVQTELMLPSLIVNLRNRSLMDCIVFGQEELAPIDGRPFFYGAFDCMTLVRDYYRFHYDIVLPMTPHGWEFWARGENLFEQTLESDTTISRTEVPVTDVREGDILFYNMFGTKYINHVGVACSDLGEIYHHVSNHVSGKYPINYGRKYLMKVVRIEK